MNGIKVCLDNIRFSKKPTKDETALINNRLANGGTLINRDNIKSFAKQVGELGHAFCPATFKRHSNETKRRIENFEQTRFFALDFDEAILFQEVSDRAAEFGLPILFAYETFRSVNQNRFRVVFLNDNSITDIRLAKIFINALLIIFPEADPKSGDIIHMYFGGKRLMYFNESIRTINPESLLRNMTYYLRKKRGSTHYKEHIRKFADKNRIRLTNKGLLDISRIENPTESFGTSDNGKISPSSIIVNSNITIIENGENLPIEISGLSQVSKVYYQINLNDHTTASVARKYPKNHKDNRSITLNDIKNKCRLFNDFNSGERRLRHDELFGISTNIIQVENGIPLFKNILSRYPEYYDNSKRSRWDFYLRYNSDQNYNPQNCDDFCHNKNTCFHGINILSTVKPKMERLANYTEVFHLLEDVEKDVTEAILNAYYLKEKMMSIIKAQTSSGKTTSYLKLMEKHPEKRFLIAAPTNILKDEIYAKARKADLNALKTPSLEAIKDETPENIRARITRLYKTGKYRSVHPYIIEILKKEDIPCLEEYMKERENVKNHTGSLITTHRYFLNMDEKRLSEYDIVIIDEDIIFKSVITNQAEITISELKMILKTADDNRFIDKIKILIKHMESGSKNLIELPSFTWDEDDDSEGVSVSFDLPSFCSAKHFYRRGASNEKKLKEDTVCFLKQATFYESIKYIMVSATVDEKICASYFGEENVSFHECKNARYIGVLYQFIGKSMSRSSMGEKTNIIKNLMEIFYIDDIEKIITFKQFHIGILHFGNTEGSNTLEGKDILVIGTPHHAEFLYKLFAFSIGVNFNEEAEMKRNRIATHNGYIFQITTYEDKNLRDIHFWMLESEMEQAVGRARLLRHPCVVYLFSNFPLKQAMMRDDIYWRPGFNPTIKK